MSNFKKIAKNILSILLVLGTIVTSVSNVKAAEETIQLGDAPNAGSYIAGVTFSHKKTTDGKPLYCIDLHKGTAKNTAATLVKNSKTVNGGLVYILKNGYPNKSITGDNKKDYYITQTAVWWYLDETTGSTNLGHYFKKDGSDKYDMRKYVKQLVQEGINHKNDSYGYTDTKLTLNTTTTLMTLSNKYYTSSDIKATTSNIGEYTVTITAPSNTLIAKSDGTEFTYTGEFKLNATDSFKIKVPASSVKNTSETITINAKAIGNIQYTAYEYQPVNQSMQNVALLEQRQVEAKDSKTLTIDSSKVTIYKVDATTNQNIEGAKLVLKDSNGNTITSWTSTLNGHIIRNLSNGTYTVEETEAPTGYILNANKTTFTVSDTDKDVKVTIKNNPKNVVVNITKVDQETNSPLAGAVLVVKDANGAVIARFTTTTSSYVLTDIEFGTYTVEEESAPEGYIRNTTPVKFTIDEQHQSFQIIIKNAKAVEVPDTASPASIITIILGIITVISGFVYVYKSRANA